MPLAVPVIEPSQATGEGGPLQSSQLGPAAVQGPEPVSGQDLLHDAAAPNVLAVQPAPVQSDVGIEATKES